jgi:D-tagatose-1,6-bisphosphate aldolase subunit GatZ/KbaZ
MSKLLDAIIQAHKQGKRRGIPSICSAHPWVLRVALRRENAVLIESTCNQVNQYGGYTGMTPLAFIRYVQNLAFENCVPKTRLILGGDHLGPNVWQEEAADSAMQKAEELISAYVKAGYTKIHVDCSMKLADDDPDHPLDIELAARRTVRLVKVAESISRERGTQQEIRYVIGNEVPRPGGAIKPQAEIRVTKVEDVQQMLEATRLAFQYEGLDVAWNKVIALVVQPGVEFGDHFVVDYDHEKALDLKRFIEGTPFVYEVHSTDYQTYDSLQNLVRDHFIILKIGPALTFAFREAVFRLAHIENDLFPLTQRSGLIERLDRAMEGEPEHWINHYYGSKQEIAFARKYSLSDRVRYYWAQPDVQAAFQQLLTNLGDKPLPLSMISLFFPQLYGSVREGKIENSVDAIISESIFSVLDGYYQACEPVPGSV